MLSDAFSYPIRQSGWMIILIGALLSIVLNILTSVPFLGLAIAIFASGYFGAFYFSIVESTMTGKDDIPDWPSVSNLWEDILLPFFRLCGLCLLCFGPVLLPFLFSEETLSVALIVLILLVLGVAYFPMAVLGVAAFGSMRGAMPDIVIPAVVKALPGYLLILGVLIAVFGMDIYLEAAAADIPLVGRFLAAGISLYGLMFQGRLIGLLYRKKREQLGWDNSA